MRTTNKLFFSWDSLTIYDGGSSTSSMMGNYCGDSIPPSQVSSINEILIHFHSDWSGTESGFQMEYNPTGKQNTSIDIKTHIFFAHQHQNFATLVSLFYLPILKIQHCI